MLWPPIKIWNMKKNFNEFCFFRIGKVSVRIGWLYLLRITVPFLFPLVWTFSSKLWTSTTTSHWRHSPSISRASRRIRNLSRPSLHLTLTTVMMTSRAMNRLLRVTSNKRRHMKLFLETLSRCSLLIQTRDPSGIHVAGNCGNQAFPEMPGVSSNA